MLQIISNLLLKIVDNIDAGNSNLTQEESIKVIEALRSFTEKDIVLSKYQACQYLNISRASFDNYVRAGKLPRGQHTAGFKELSYSKKDLDQFIEKMKDERKHKR